MNNKLLLDSEQLNLKLIDHDKDAKDMSWLRYKRKYRVLKKKKTDQDRIFRCSN